MELYNSFEPENHLLPDFPKSEFEKLSSWELGWALLEPLNIADGEENEKTLAKRFSPGQKALYFFWYLDGQVTNGGFIQFYFNGYRQYIPPIIEGLKLIGDKQMETLVEEADREYIQNSGLFESKIKKGDLKSLYKELKGFEQHDEQFFKVHDNTMELIERYARQKILDFVNLI